MKYDIVDIDNWHRKEQFEFFRTFDEPFTGIVVDVNVSKAYQVYKKSGRSFFQIYLHKCLKACITTKAFRLRLVEGEVRAYEIVHASAVIMRSDRSFGFSHIAFSDDFNIFSANIEVEKARIEKDRSLFPPKNAPNAIHCSAMPWLRFTSVSHARKFNTEDSCPKISFGKVYMNDNERWMPVSVHVHHALADGIDIGEFIDNYQKELDSEL